MRRRQLFQLAGATLVAACGVLPVAPITLQIVTAPPYTQHTILEVALTLREPMAANYDIVATDLWVEAQCGTTRLRVPAFWYQDFDPQTLAPTGTPGWRARCFLTTNGDWQLIARHGTDQSAPLVVSVAVATDKTGMVQVDGNGFAYADGSPFVPIGVNLGWATGQGAQVISDYTRWLTQLAANGGNASRIWMASWSFGLEWRDTPLGDYTNRLRQAWLLDQVLALAATRGVRVMLSLLNHGAFSTTTNPEWDANPYNQANGGPLTDPAQFVTDATARRWFAQRVRYIGARYAASPAVWCWEWWNEINWTPIQERDLAPWLVEMQAVMHEVDPYTHPITSSWASVSATSLWDAPTLAMMQHHLYSSDDVVRSLNTAQIPIRALLAQKPLLLSEVGLDAGGADAPDGVEYVHLHNTVWAPLMMGYAGTGMYWWWDSWLDPQQHWTVFAGIKEFVAGIRVAGMRRSAPKCSDNAIARGIYDDTQALIWVRHAHYTAQKAMQAYMQTSQPPADWHYAPNALPWQTLTIKGLRDGQYAVTWFDPQTATWGATAATTVANGTTQIDVPPLTIDMAVRLVRQ